MIVTQYDIVLMSKTIHWGGWGGEMQSFQQVVPGKLEIHRQNNEVVPLPHIIHGNELKVTDLKVGSNTMKNSQKKTQAKKKRKKIHDFRLEMLKATVKA